MKAVTAQRAQNLTEIFKKVDDLNLTLFQEFYEYHMNLRFLERDDSSKHAF